MLVVENSALLLTSKRFLVLLMSTALILSTTDCRKLSHKRVNSDDDSIRSSCPSSAGVLRSWGQWASKSNASSWHLSLLAPDLAQPHFNKVHKSELYRNPVLAGDDACPTELNQLHDDPLMIRSLCPWYWRINYDPLRIPATLPEARCRCERAVTGSRVFLCHLLKIRIRVGRFDATCRQFQDDELELPIACVSVLQPKLPLDPRDFTGVQKTFLLDPLPEI